MACTGERDEPRNSCSLIPGWERVKELGKQLGGLEGNVKDSSFVLGRVVLVKFQILETAFDSDLG